MPLSPNDDDFLADIYRMPSTLNLEGRNALLAVPEWGKLLHYFELGESFALVVLLVPDTAVSRMCQTELDLWLRARQRPRLTPVPIENPEVLSSSRKDC